MGNPVHVQVPTTPHEALEKGARLGFAARGLVYIIVGGFAVLAAIGRGGTTDTEGALQVLLSQPFGKLLLAAVSLGLVGYAIWRVMMAVRDPERRRDEGRGATLARRAGYLISGASNLALAAFAGSLALPGMIPALGGGGSGGTQDWTATLMAQPFGRWLVALVGVAFLGVAMGFAVRAVRASFERHFDPAARTPTIRSLSRAGIFARAIVFAVIGGFFLLAAWQADPSEAKGLAAALTALRAQPFGAALLAGVGAGLAAYGCYSLIAARWRRIRAA